MSTAFMVDNILQDKEDHIDSFTSASDSESEPTSDHKDSICDSPSFMHHAHHNPNSQDTDDLIQSYTVIRDSASDSSEDTNNRGTNGDGGGGGIQLCCGKCGHLQYGIKMIIDNEIQYEFKCDKCESCDYLIPNPIIKDSLITSTGNNNTTQTILKDTISNNNGVNSKPVLKFSVSAILGERKDCVKVRNGELIFFFQK